MAEAEEHFRPAIFLIKEIEISKIVAETVSLPFVCNWFVGFEVFKKFAGFTFWRN